MKFLSLKDFEVHNEANWDEARRRWRSAVTIVKNQRRRFRFVPDLDKRKMALKAREILEKEQAEMEMETGSLLAAQEKEQEEMEMKAGPLLGAQEKEQEEMEMKAGSLLRAQEKEKEEMETKTGSLLGAQEEEKEMEMKTGLLLGAKEKEQAEMEMETGSLLAAQEKEEEMEMRTGLLLGAEEREEVEMEMKTGLLLGAEEKEEEEMEMKTGLQLGAEEKEEEEMEMKTGPLLGAQEKEQEEMEMKTGLLLRAQEKEQEEMEMKTGSLLGAQEKEGEEMEMKTGLLLGAEEKEQEEMEMKSGVLLGAQEKEQKKMAMKSGSLLGAQEKELEETEMKTGSLLGAQIITTVTSMESKYKREKKAKKIGESRAEASHQLRRRKPKLTLDEIRFNKRKSEDRARERQMMESRIRRPSAVEPVESTGREALNADEKHKKRFKSNFPQQITLERILVVINFILELPSAVLDNVPSVPRPLCALILMLLSFAALLLCIFELVYQVRKKTDSGTQRGSNENERPFFSNVYNIVGFISAVCQSIITTVNYVLLVQHTKIQIHLSVLPIIFAFVLLCSKFHGRERSGDHEAYRRNGGHEA